MLPLISSVARLVVFVISLMVLNLPSLLQGSAKPPNIIFILADDLGYGDLGVTGHPYVQTPHIDRLANEGIRFENAYMSAAWCAPSRAALMGGLYPARYFNSTRELAVERPSLTQVLRDAGYATAHYGKWHLGGHKATDPAPVDYGIDESFIDNGNSGEHPTWTGAERSDPHHREKTTERYVDLALDFIDRTQDKPFFINLWVYPTHSYINPTVEQLAVYKDLQVEINDFKNPLQREFLKFVAEHGDIQAAMRAYCADVTALDTDLGRLMEALQERGLDENTIVIFSSDNGPGPLCNNWDRIAERYQELPLLLNNVGASGPFRDRKISLHDGGTHVPFFVHWPARIKGGSVDMETVLAGVDLLPTLATIVQAQTPEDLDGIDLSAAWLGQPQQRAGPIYWNDRPGWSALRDKQWKAHLQGKKFRLYDLLKDPSESEDLSRDYPEVAGRYFNALKKWEASLPAKKRKP